MTAYLPFEILIAIFEKVHDVQDLRNIRTASRTLCAAATPIAFRRLSVTSTAGSAQNLGRLFDVPEIAAYVKEVAYRDTGAVGRILTPELLKFGASSPSPLVPQSNLTWALSVRTSATHELASSFSRIHQLPQLETIDLTFLPADGHWFDFDGGVRLALQRSILVALASSFSSRAPLKPISLSLHNLRTWDIAPLESPPFQSVLKNLRHLRLSVLHDSAHDAITALHRWSYFWGTLCFRLILAPTQHALTKLTLHTKTLVGASMGLSFTGLYFPNLRVLSLRNFVFEPSVDVEPFILQHAATLVRLELISCKLFIPNDEEPTRWEHIWDSFAIGLTALVALHVDESRVGVFEKRYVRHQVRHGPVSYWDVEAPAHLDVADAAALERFYVTVAARSEERRSAS
jgi:hypothetical protein